MHKNILFDILKTLSKSEMKRLITFAESPYFNTNTGISRLLKILAAQHPEFKAGALKAEKIFKKLYPGRKYSRQSLVVRFSELTSLVKNFLAVSEFESDTFLKSSKLSDAYLKRGLQKSLGHELGKHIDELSRLKFTETGYAGKMLELHQKREKYFYGKAKYISQIEEMLLSGKYLVVDFLIKACSISTAINEYKAAFEYEAEENILEDFFAHFDFNSFIQKTSALDEDNTNMLSLHRNLMLLLSKNSDEKYLNSVKEILYKNHSAYNKKIVDEIQRSITGAAAFFLSSEIKTYKQSSEVYKFLLGINHFPAEDNGVLDPVNFKNIHTQAILGEEFEWAEEVVEKLHRFLPESERENSYHYCMGISKHYIKDYEASLDHFSRIKIQDIYMDITMRTFNFKNFYELNLFEQMLSLVDASKHFLKNSRLLTGAMKHGYLKMFRYMGMLARHRIDKKPLTVRLYEQFENSGPMSEKYWIRSRMKQLMSG
jgi:hypothetical protein